MQFKLAYSCDSHKVYTAWQYNLEFTLLRYTDASDPDMLTIWDHESQSVLIEKEMPKPKGDVS